MLGNTKFEVMKMNQKPTPKTDRKLQEIETIFTDREQDGILSDILGSYTGTGYADDQPEQDVDDL